MVGGKETKVEVTLDSVDLPHAQIISTITAFRIGSKRLTASSIGQLLDALDVRFALVLTPTEKQQVWSKRSKKSKSALLVGTARDALEIGALVGEQRNDWSGPGIDPDVPLLREDPGDRRRGKGAKNPLKWWFYASIIGAVGLGAAFIIASDLADDKQRVEVTFP